ncbi:DUF4190 domain-containing protein [Demequina mangrovi]|uniref:DUF4190 domain-containing protein n=1 Tax=Demequina mangrovi TaxID=1043493 RepID=A0A1H7AD22_9MICO|nr:DUF4190 domain-containing protein [Demequina mangrovi]SEJ59760.1 hypothetical protein SAMN05421637_2373 [Demequina mangrovi]
MVETVGTSVEDDARIAEGGNGVGITAFVTACLGLGPVAIVLGIIGLARWRSGAASRRSWPLAGLVLGIVGTLLVAAGWLLHQGSQTSDGAILAHAKVDVITVGNAVVERFAADPELTGVDVDITADGYVVDGAVVARTSEADVALTYEGSTAYDWCVTIAAGPDGGQTAAFTATGGLVAECPAG